MPLDARLQAMLVEAVDTRFRELERQRPYSAYGTVASVDLASRTASVYVSADAVPSVGFRYEKVTPVAGARVRVVIDPRGDRYIDDVYGEGYFRTERPVGGTYLLGSVAGDASTVSRARLATDGSGLPTLYLGNGAEAVGSETVQVARNASGELALRTNATTNALQINDRPVRMFNVEQPGSGSVFIADTAIGRSGGALLISYGNDGAGVIGWYRNGSFNYVSGLWSGPGSVGFQGTTFSPGAHTWSWYIEGSGAGARLALKSSAGFSRTFGLWVLG